MSTQTHAEVQEYLNRMRTALADLPTAEVREIMEDAGSHVAEIAGELGEEFSSAALEKRLGTPEVYAQELRTAAGYPAAAPARAALKPRLGARFAFWSLVFGTLVAVAVGADTWGFLRGSPGPTLLVALCLVISLVLVFRRGADVREVADLPEALVVRSALAQAQEAGNGKWLAYLRSLQPGWWLVRAALIVLLGFLTREALGLVLLAIAAAVSVHAGPKAKSDRRWLWVSLPASGFAAGAVLLVLGYVSSGGMWRSAADPYTATYYNPPPSSPSNIYVFDQNGKPLTDVFLYDENGQPIDSPFYGCDGHQDDVNNKYPRPKVEHGSDGCREIDGVPFTVAIPKVTSSTPVPTSSSPVPSTTTAPPTTSTTG
jgi:hypothetical protein